MQFPPPAVIDQWRGSIIQFLNYLGQAWTSSGGPEITVTSWYRPDSLTDELREESGSTVTGPSQHGIGCAIDFVGPGSAEFAQACKDQGLVIKLEPNGSWHVQLYARGSWYSSTA
jgi:hypothetical protein